jgi:ABC-type amino acid transport substrate-binding protein
MRPWAVLLVTSFACALPCEGSAQVPGALERIRDSGVVRIGYREESLPFSAARPDGSVHGYSIDLCLAIVQELGSAAGKPLKVSFHRVTPENRIDQVTERRIDLECGSTTINAQRRERVAFSPVIFVAATRLLVKRGSALYSLQELSDKTLVAVAGTTNARAVMDQGAGRVRNLRVRTARRYDEALTMLDTDGAQAMAADDILLAGLLTGPGMRERFMMVGEPLTQESYGIVFPRDDIAFATAVTSAFVRLATTGELRTIYERWFLQPLPSGANLGLPIGGPLLRNFRLLGLPPE